MSADLEVLALKESDVTKMLVASTHLGSKNINYQMRQYIHSRNSSGFHVINLKKMYDKLLLAARAIVAVENPADVFVISANPLAQRAVLKFARHTGATPIAGRYTPGCFTNQIQSTFREPRLLVVADPTNDSLPILEASYVNIPVIAFANASSPCSYVDIIIPCNNSGVLSMGLSWWMLAREVLRMRGTIPRKGEWEEMPDLFFHRDQEAIKREEQAKRDQAAQEAEEAAAQAAAVVAVDDDFNMGGMAAAAGAAGADDWNKDWSGGGADEDWATADSQRWT